MNIIETILKADVETKVFILLSLVFLIFVQYKLFKIRLKKLRNFLIFLLHVAFGALLYFVSKYHFLVHISVYVLPSLIIAGLIHFIGTINFKAKKQQTYKFYFRTVRGTKVIITNIFRHIALIGGAGSGKTRGFIKWLIMQMAKYNFSGLIHDYKKFDLAKTAYTHYLDSNVQFKGINFFSLRHSFQFNPISLKAIPAPAYANEVAHTFIVNLSKMTKTTDPYFVEAAESLLAAVIWKFREDIPNKCYFPYVATYLMLATTEQVNDFLSTNMQAELLASPYRKIIANEKGASSIESTLANALRKVALPEIFWVLSGDDIDPELNNPESPVLLCITNTMKLEATYAPIIAMIIDVCSKSMSEPNKNPSGVIVEEGSVIYLPSLAKMAATLREYLTFVLFCIQDITQGELLYERLGIKSLLGNLGTHIYGRVMDMETAEKYAKMYGRFFKRFTSRTRNSSSLGAKSYTESERQVYVKEPEEFLQLEPFHFFGLVAEGNVKKFDETFLMYDEEEFDIPEVKDVTPQMVKANFEKVYNEIKMML
ncbi:MAG: type IV secretory system conjugative DNA transfer family protein [Ignavibacteria bacterium]|nr:type IV secretory system conjugative DNA transfer family protein [Ignavibacteria bacterium]